MTLTAQLARTALGQLRGSIDLVAPARSKHVGIFFDVKCSGEATHRPHLRIPPLQRGDATTLKPLLEVARARLAPPRLPTGMDAPEGSLDAGDIYFLLDGGMSGNVGAMRKAFNSKDKVSKTFTVLKDLASVDKRHERVRGVGNVKQTETLLVVSQNQINLPPVKYQQFTGGTNGDVIGPVVLAPPETQWQATWAEKKRSSGRISSSKWAASWKWTRPQICSSAKSPVQTIPWSQCSFIACLSCFTKSSWSRSTSWRSLT